MSFNYIDLIAILLIAFFLWRGYSSGFWAYLARLITLILGIIAAFYAYAPMGSILATELSLSPRLASVISFVGTLIIVEAVLGYAFKLVYRRFPRVFFENRYTRASAAIPALLDVVIVILMLVVATTALPLPTHVSSTVAESVTGTFAARGIPVLQGTLDRATGGRLSRALSELTTYPSSGGEVRTLPFKPSSTAIDEEAERRLLALVNEERAKVGAPALTIDPALILSARRHSADMWERQYFAHENPDGESPFDRMLAAGAVFLLAGENLALAPTTELAHRGLMNSPGHRRNILDPNFKRIGIGIIDGGIYGKMVTQNFAN